ncbi:alginate lyase [Clostridium niameyense]|uniref:Alginate lyase n=1 Tax=Clostridium niameyense TaxID=1622073 RepID=A0A6M0R6D7_9CLOT|nr:alginate lyase [Clostridium niameyense]NEZ45733.1 alginate lyase [Clostridium niameyense]
MLSKNCPFFENARGGAGSYMPMTSQSMPYGPMPYGSMPWCNQPMQQPMYGTSNMTNTKEQNQSTTTKPSTQNTQSTPNKEMSIPPMPIPKPMNGIIGASEPVQDNINYNQGFLKTQIGRRIKIEFLIGTNMLIDREGTLISVGISYLLIREVDTNDLIMADMYSIKFVRIFD